MRGFWLSPRARPPACARYCSLTPTHLKKCSYGPETITWDDSALDGEYFIVVHVFSSSTSLQGSEIQVLVSLRGGESLVTVQPTKEVLGSACDKARCSDGDRCCYWWVGTITKTGNAYKLGRVNAEIGKPSTAC